MSQVELVKFYEQKIEQDQGISEREWREYESA